MPTPEPVGESRVDGLARDRCDVGPGFLRLGIVDLLRFEDRSSVEVGVVERRGVIVWRGRGGFCRWNGAFGRVANNAGRR